MPLWTVSRYGTMLIPANKCADCLQYAYLSHFYANALSIFLDQSITQADISAEHFEAVRNLPSFQQ